MKNTLKTFRDFKVVMDKGKVFKMQQLNIFYIKKDDFFNIKPSPLYINNPFTFGIITSRKLGKAHVRNYLKRLIRNAIKTQVPKNDYFYVFLIRSNKMTPAECNSALEFAFSKIFN